MSERPRTTPGLTGSAGIVLDRFRHVSFLEERDVRDVRRAAPALRTAARTITSAPQVDLDPESAAYYEALCSRWGLLAGRYRASIFRRRQAASLRAIRARGVREAAAKIIGDSAAAERALAAVMIGVTAFFRDHHVFASLRTHLQVLHQTRGPMNVMSVGCSDGSELYSVAMLMADDGILDGSSLWGIDCRPAAIAKAREALYPVEAVEAVPTELRKKCLEPASMRTLRRRRGGSVRAVRIAERLREACEWEVADAFAQPVQRRPRLADVILCRNLAIYLTPDSADELWSMLMSQLSPGGVLVVGKAERPSAAVRSLLTRTGPCVYQRSESNS